MLALVTPYFTTDTAGSLRAIEINADVILKGTRVDGIYTADPEKDPTATKYNTITFQECFISEFPGNGHDSLYRYSKNNCLLLYSDMNKEGNLADA